MRSSIACDEVARRIVKFNPQRSAILVLLFAGATQASAKECKLFVDATLRQACFTAAEEAKAAARAATAAADKAAIAAAAEDDATAASASQAPAEATKITAAPSLPPCGFPWETECKQPSKDQSDPWIIVPGLTVSDKLDATGSSRGASFGASTANGETSVKANIAAAYRLPFGGAPAKYGWDWGIGGQWGKDNGAKTKVDGRVVRLFAEGMLPNVPILGAARLDGVEDNVSKEKTVGLRLNATFIPNFLQQNPPYNDASSARPAYNLYFSAGTHLDRITYARAPDTAGGAGGLNGRIDADFYPNGALWNLHFFATYVRAKDLFADTGRPKRSSTFYDFGVEWAFMRPDKKGKGLIPALSLHRTIGDNFLDGTSRSVTTSLVLTVKTN